MRPSTPGAPVLDSYALLALLRDESGGETVARLLERANQHDQPVHMTEVSYAKVQYMIRHKDGDAAWTMVTNELKTTSIEFHPASRPLADLASDFKARFRMSLADAFAVALQRWLRKQTPQPRA